MSNDFWPEGQWEPFGNEPDPWSWLYFETKRTTPVNIFGMDFHVMAIAVTGGDVQDAASKFDQHNLEALHEAGGSDTGYDSIEINGRPYVVFLVPYDR